MEDEIAQSCLVPGISVSFQKSYFYYTNWLSPLSMLLSVWCAVANAAVIIALFRSGVKRLRPSLLMVCSLTLSDLIWGAYVSPLIAGFRIKHFLNTQVCDVYLELEDQPKDIPAAMYFLGTFGNLAIITVDRYLAVHYVVQYKYMVTRRRALIACCLVWLTTTTLVTVRQVSGYPAGVFHVLVAAFVVLSAAVIIVGQIMTLRHLRHHNSTIAEMIEEGGQANPVNTANAAAERALTKATIYVVGLLALLFIPLISVTVTAFVIKKPLVKLVEPILFPLITVFSGINPVLYYRGNAKVKEGIYKLVRCQ